MNAVVGSQRTTTDTGNGNPDFQERIASVTGPDGQGMYKVTVINNDDISSSYLTKNPPRNPQFFVKDVDEGEDDSVDLEPKIRGLKSEFNKFMKNIERTEIDPAYANKADKRYEKMSKIKHPLQQPDHEVDEGDNLQTFEDIIRLSGAPIKENVLTDHTRHTLKHIIHTFGRDIKDWIQHGDMTEHLYDALYDYYYDDMPYGVKKAKSRDRDPTEWIGDRFYDDLRGHGVLDEAGVQVRKVRSPNIVRVQAVPSADIKSLKFNDDPLPMTDLDSSSMIQGPDIALSMMDLDPSPVAGLDITDDNEPMDECNYTMENRYCPVHGLEECYGQGVYESELARIKSLAQMK
jgi:hypothetical protein